jgi:hypothetical protein
MSVFNPKDHQMNRYRLAAIAGAGMMFVTAPALAGMTSIAGPKLITPDSQFEQTRYVNPEAIMGGVISGVLSGVVGGDCYFNDCGYDNGYYGGGGGGGYGGGGRGYRGGGHGGGVRVGHAVGGGGGHASGGGHAGGRR